jgi:transposase-like protein
MMRKAEESRRWSMMLLPEKKKEIVLLKRLKGRRPMEKPEKPKVERLGMGSNKKGRKVSGHTAAEKCRAVLSVWTEKRRPGEVCRELGVAWSSLNQWQDRAMEGMLMALQPRVVVDKDLALNSRLAVLLERKIKGGAMKGLDRRLAKLQVSPVVNPRGLREVAAEKKS